MRAQMTTSKPFAADELAARIRALSRRAPAPMNRPWLRRRRGRPRRPCRHPGGQHRFGSRRPSGTCWKCCCTIATAGAARDAAREVWGPQYTTDTGYLRLYLAPLRKKLEPVPSEPRYFVTEAGMGYRFVSDQQDS